MSKTVKLKRSAVPGKIPPLTSLNLGEVAINTYDGKMYIKKDDGTESIVEIGADYAVENGLTIDSGTRTIKLGGEITENTAIESYDSDELYLYFI